MPGKQESSKANALSVATYATAVTRELSDLLQVAPARAAASILLMILDTVEVGTFYSQDAGLEPKLHDILGGS